MTDKVTDGSAAYHMMEVIKHFTKLASTLDDLQWHICFGNDPGPYAFDANKHCRELRQAIQSLEERLKEADKPKIGVVK